MLKFDGFNNRAQYAINIAYQQAGEMGHRCVDTEHLVLGLASDDSGITSELLREHGAGFERFRDHIIEASGTVEGRKLNKDDISAKAQKAIELAYTKAKMLEQQLAGPEHLLFVLLQQRGCVGNAYLQELGVNLYKLQADLMEPMKNQVPADDKAIDNTIKRRLRNPTPTLNQFGVDLTERAAQQHLDPIVGRSREIDRALRVLSRRTKNSLCLIGAPGVGKTAIAEGLAQKIAGGEVTGPLQHKRIISLDLNAMVAGTKYRGEFEQRVENIMEEVRKCGDIILFMDELHMIAEAGSCEGAMSIGNILKPKLSRGDIQIIGATTVDEYRRYIEKDGALERRFQPLTVEEPTREMAVEMLNQLRPRYEEFHNVSIPAPIIEAAVQLADRYIQDRQLPDKAIDLIDEGAACARAGSNGKARPVVTVQVIKKLIAEMTGIDAQKLDQDACESLMHLESQLHKRVVGQHEAVSAVARTIRRNKAGLGDGKKPVGSFLFLGPTGVGKTELCQALADIVYTDQEALIKLDMSEYKEQHSISKLIGAAPGYVGYEDAGQLTEQVRRKPYAVVLLDEIEKAHPDVWNLLLQVLEDGVLTDAQGHKVSFAHTIVVMTSNVGAECFDNQRVVGFCQSDGFVQGVDKKKMAMEELKKTFRPEIINRINEIVVFDRLQKEHLKEIARKMMNQLAQKVLNIGMNLIFTPSAIEYLADTGYEQEYGARPLSRCIQSNVEDLLADLILSGQAGTGATLVCDFERELQVYRREKCAV